ncbi:MAG: hypothetical protein IPF67_00265 [Saprospiraceae bacterium]|nr:hypothetical protein [Candidatus Brachybacter algidus]
MSKNDLPKSAKKLRQRSKEKRKQLRLRQKDKKPLLLQKRSVSLKNNERKRKKSGNASRNSASQKSARVPLLIPKGRKGGLCWA